MRRERDIPFVFCDRFFRDYSVAFMPRVTFEPSGVAVDLRAGESVFDAGRRVNVLIPTACMAKGTCGLCRVKIISGAEHLPPPSAVEQRHLGNTYFITRLRLSCQITPTSDLTVRIPDAK
jgi:ferredoxin